MADVKKRIGRYAKVATSAARVGGSIAARRAVGRKNESFEAALIRSALGNLKGPWMKIGQLLAVIPDFLPESYAAELAMLQSHAPSMGVAFVRQRMAQELGVDWRARFEVFEEKARFAASLGQVHFARSRDGRTLAIKIRYPGMDDAVEADLRQLKIAFMLLDRLGGAVKTDGVFEEIRDCLSEELDYSLEAGNMTRFGAALQGLSGVRVPVPQPDFLTSGLLGMDWLEGAPFLEAAGAKSQGKKNDIAQRLFRLWYTPFYRQGLLHGDPHPGNYTLAKDGTINLLDFGCARAFGPDIPRAVTLLFEALERDEKEKAVEAYRLWGFKKPSKALIEALNIWARFIYGPFLEDKVRGLEETNAVSLGRAALVEVYRELRKIGAIAVPRPFVIVDRASVGLGAVFLRLQARLNWHRLLKEVMDGAD